MLKNWADKIKDSSNELVNRVNGYGVLLRFVLPILVGLLGWSLNMNINNLKDTQVEFKKDLNIFKNEMTAYNTNHLVHHSDLEKTLEGRLACIETLLRKK